MVEALSEFANGDGRGQRVLAFVVRQRTRRPDQNPKRTEDSLDLVVLAGRCVESGKFLVPVAERFGESVRPAACASQHLCADGVSLADQPSHRDILGIAREGGSEHGRLAAWWAVQLHLIGKIE
jgi:hypothetical protein